MHTSILYIFYYILYLIPSVRVPTYQRIILKQAINEITNEHMWNLEKKLDTIEPTLQRGKVVHVFVFLTLYLFLEDVAKPRLSTREVPQEPEPRSFISTSTNPIPSSHRAVWSERTADQDWRFGHIPVRVRARRSNPRPHPPGPPHVRREASANMAQQCGPGQQALGNGGGSSPDGWI